MKDNFYFFGVLLLIILFLFCLVCTILYFRDKIRRNIDSYSRTSFQKTKKRHIKNEKKAALLSINLIISEETALQILNGLELFEKQLQFREKGITQGKLATRLETNTRYLSAIIKDYKAENFNLYINRLRINYIFKRLENDAEYRKYKVSYLAEDAGYTNASSFARIFKEITGITPSSYIDQLRKDASVQ
ncbi:helix-turn-helix domain-containing protein [Chryseobacterium sp. PMSZPI]|uniref:helix-turn-helix domain-containing protein n=1 Tax=Chryseobacterium sp. PMSZPI TaxID=1033900 RepID=UPI00399FAB8D